MGQENDIIEILRHPRKGEREIFDGRTLRDFHSFARDIRGGNRVLPHHIDFFFNLTDRFVSVSRPFLWAESKSLEIEKDAMRPGTSFSRSFITVAQEDRRGKNFYTLDHISAFASDKGFLTTIRPYPIHWHMDHIFKRSEERGGMFHRANNNFLTHNNMTLMMLRLIEDVFYTGENPYFPFILPERNGLLVGHTMKALRAAVSNRVFMAVAKDETHLNLDTYEWFPKLEATFRTFLGPKEMTPDLQRLRMQLLKYYNPSYRNSMSVALDSYIATEHSNAYMLDARRHQYEGALRGLVDIMLSPLWERNVRLPVHLRKAMGRPEPSF